jgi:deoxyadenosine/deoxycytidine kinase
MACLTKMEKLLETLKNPKITSQYIFLDRSIDTDLNVFSLMYINNKTYSKLEYLMFKKFYQIYQNHLKPSNKQFHIYLKCSPEKSLERIKKRNRPEESNITLEYLQMIYNYHEKWLNDKNKPNENVIIFDCENDFVSNPEMIKQMMNIIKMKINI